MKQATFNKLFEYQRQIVKDELFRLKNDTRLTSEQLAAFELGLNVGMRELVSTLALQNLLAD